MRMGQFEHSCGAAMVQIVEASGLPTVRVMKLNGRRVSHAFQVDDGTCIRFMYASESERESTWGDYTFNFTSQSLDELRRVQAARIAVWLGLICVGGREICCTPFALLLSMIEERRQWMVNRFPARDADACVLGVALPPGKYFRVGITAPWSSTIEAITEHKIPRNAFPRAMLRKHQKQ